MSKSNLVNKDWKTIKYRLRKGLWGPFLAKLYRPLFRLKKHKGIKVMEEEWDYLIILDACRYDAFKTGNFLKGKLEKRISSGSGTPDWLQNNFTDYYDDVVYVSANAFVSPIKELGNFDSSEHFFKLVPVYMTDNVDAGVPTPEEVTEAAIDTAKRYPHKRMIIHYVQPHDPFIGKPRITAEDVNDKYEYFNRKDSWEAYLGNLKRALKAVEKLVKKLKGNIVITADHGDMFGEWGLHRHYDGIYFKKLVEVPWFIINKKS